MYSDEALRKRFEHQMITLAVSITQWFSAAAVYMMSTGVLRMRSILFWEWLRVDWRRASENFSSQYKAYGDVGSRTRVELRQKRCDYYSLKGTE